VVENNGYAEATSCRYSVSVADIAERAPAFNMPGIKVDGHDFLAVYEAAGEAIERARGGGGPTLIECKVARYFGHYEGDTQAYRGTDEVKKVRETRDCIAALARTLREAGAAGAAELEQIERDVVAEVDDAIAYARSAPYPNASDLLNDVYISY